MTALVLAAELAPAWIGLVGVVLGIGITQLSELVRSRREDTRAMRTLQREAIVRLLHAVADVGALAVAVARTGGLEMDRMLDDAALPLNRTIDEIRLLGPQPIVDPMLRLFDPIVAMYDSSTRRNTSTFLEELARDSYQAKLAFIQAVRAQGLIGPDSTP